MATTAEIAQRIARSISVGKLGVDADDMPPAEHRLAERPGRRDGELHVPEVSNAPRHAA